MFVLLCWKNEQQAAQGIVPASKFCEEPYWRLPDRNLRRGRRFISQEETSKARQMRTGHSLKQNQSKPILDRPVLAAMAVAVFGMLAMLIVDHGPWNRPQLQIAEVASYKTTGEAARAVGATVTPTVPKPALEPNPPGPNPAQPANPATP
jgi:hypothetical protein